MIVGRNKTKLNEVLYCELTEGNTIERMKTSHNLGRCCGLRYQKRTDSGGVKGVASRVDLSVSQVRLAPIYFGYLRK